MQSTLVGKGDSHLITVSSTNYPAIKTLEFVPVILKGRNLNMNTNEQAKKTTWTLDLHMEVDESVFHVCMLRSATMLAQNRILISIVKKKVDVYGDCSNEEHETRQRITYSGSILVLKENMKDPSKLFLEIEHELTVIESQECKVHMHFIMEKNITGSKLMSESVNYENGFYEASYTCVCELLVLILGKRKHIILQFR